MSNADVLLLGYDSDDNLSIRSLAAFLVQHHIHASVETCDRSRKEELLGKITEERPKIVGFSIAFQAMVDDFRDVIDHLRTNGVRAHFTAGGHIPTIASEAIFEIVPGLDTAVRHEGEFTLLELYRHLDQPHLWPGIQGLVCRQGDVVRAAPPRPLIEDLDSLPFPLRGDTFQTSRGLGLCSMLASRGCNYNCSFCSIRQYYSDAQGRRHRLRSPALVAEEMEELFRRGVRIFIFDDDDLGTKSKSEKLWIEQFARELEGRGLSRKILWSMFCRVDEANADLLGRLKECGLAFVCMGIESGNEQGLKTLNKGFHVEDVFRAVNILERLGLLFEYGFMMFDPASSWQSVKANLQFLEELCRDGRVPVRFTKMVPLMGTPIARSLRDAGRLKGTLACPTYSHPDQRLDLLELFWAQAFGRVAFRRKGLVDRLRSARKDAVIVDKFFPDRFDAAGYSRAITRLIRAFNDSAFETMHKAVEFMEPRRYADILYYWNLLDLLGDQELEVQSRLAAALDRLEPAETVA